jgi:tetratricopeptide (TPR) repeat protein
MQATQTPNKIFNVFDPCPCGSKQPFAQCCGQMGLPLAMLKMKTPPELVKAINALREEGKGDVALKQARTLLALMPNEIPALELLADILRRRGELKALVEPLTQLAKLQPGNHARHTDLATVHHQLRDLPKAEAGARQAMALNPMNAQAHNLLGMIYSDLSMPEEAEFHFREVLLLHEPVSPVCINLANAYKNMGRLREAESFYRQGMYLDPNNLDGLLAWVRMEEARAEIDRAWELLDRIPENLRQQVPGAFIARSALHRRGKDFDKALAELDDLAVKFPKFAQLPMYFYERGEVLDGMKNFKEAFAAFTQANDAVRAMGNRDYNEAQFQQMSKNLKSVFTRGAMTAVRENTVIDPLPPEMPSPIFIVGFPRSGTTLVEQMLTRHSNISAGDELPYIWRLTQLSTHLTGAKKPYPMCLENLLQPQNRHALRKFRSFYLANVEVRNIVEPGKQRFTDKMPLNETNLGLIHLIFPEAPIVHLVRHPLDVVLSSFFHDLTHGGNCAYGLATAAKHYALIFDLIQHYKSELDLKYHAVRYEDLVDDAEPNLRGLIDFLGEPWEDQCLKPHENARYARTASYAQVKEKIYTRSRFRYRNYMDHLDPILPILQPAIEKLGYPI